MKDKKGTVNIHGKQYKTVALRVSEFRDKYEIESGWGLHTEILSINEKAVLVQASVVSPNGTIIAQGLAEEQRKSTGVNSTSAVENAETSALGRALAAAGFAGEEYASADEVAQAITEEHLNKTLLLLLNNRLLKCATPQDFQVVSEEIATIPKHLSERLRITLKQQMSLKGVTYDAGEFKLSA